jgi:hypothetical protein
MTTNSTITPELLDQLLANYEKPEDLTGEDGLFKQLKKALIERALGAELTEHLGYEKGDPAGRGSGNSRNGSSPKTVLTPDGEIEIAVPRDRAGSFEPVLLGAHLRCQAPRVRARRCAASGLDCSARPSTLATMPLTAHSRCNQNGKSPSQKPLTQKLRTLPRPGPIGDAQRRLVFEAGSRLQKFGPEVGKRVAPAAINSLSPCREASNLLLAVRS